MRMLVSTIAASAATYVTWLTVSSQGAGTDDANIFFVYARHLSAGEGFVFNQGGERVEGFTSMLWVLIGALASKMAPHMELTLLLVNVLLVGGTIACGLGSVVLRGKSGRGEPVWWQAAFVAATLLNLSYVTWATIALMETALWSFLLVLGTMQALEGRPLQRRRWLLPITACLMLLTRPEAMLWVPVLIAVAYLSVATAEGHSQAARAVAPMIAISLLTIVVLTIFRLQYFGFPLPNTYYAKVPPSMGYRLEEGFQYLRGYVSSGLLAGASAIAVLVSAIHAMASRDRRSLSLAFVGTAALLVPVAGGGDHFQGYRFYQAVSPLLLLNLVHCLRSVVPRYVRMPLGRMWEMARTGAVASAVGIVLGAQSIEWLHPEHRPDFRREFELAHMGRARGTEATRLFADAHPRPSIATITVGGFKYGYEGEVVDIMGLNNTLMAHNGGSRMGYRSHAAFDATTFYTLSPDVLLPLVHQGSLAALQERNSFVDLVLKGLLDDPHFRHRYALAEVRRPLSGGVVSLAGWYRRDLLVHLDTLQIYEIRLPMEHAR